ncbi:MAG TPA: 5'-methylthioadenosine/adenosylhomocysteine nucleosidase [Acidimicrobiia bacterium]|nr:5'-methylthioadenosine/adenosylhomocysteine nucleosidase [Acidimicrobiia bacterium]
MTVAILSALQTELDLLIESLDGPDRSEIADWPIWVGTYRSSSVALAKAGLGKVNTAALSALLWDRIRPSLMVFTGVAGGLDPSLGVGDVVVGERTVQHDTGVIAPGGKLERYQAGHIPFYNPTDEDGYRPSSSTLATMRRVIPTARLTTVLERQPTVTFGTILTGDQFLRDEGTRQHLFTDFGAQAIEMEGAALAQTAARLGVDHLVIRALSDLAQGEAVVHFDRFVPEVSANSARLVLALLTALDEGDQR